MRFSKIRHYYCLKDRATLLYTNFIWSLKNALNSIEKELNWQQSSQLVNTNEHCVNIHINENKAPSYA